MSANNPFFRHNQAPERPLSHAPPIHFPFTLPGLIPGPFRFSSALSGDSPRSPFRASSQGPCFFQVRFPVRALPIHPLGHLSRPLPFHRRAFRARAPFTLRATSQGPFRFPSALFGRLPRFSSGPSPRPLPFSERAFPGAPLLPHTCVARPRTCGTGRTMFYPVFCAQRFLP